MQLLVQAKFYFLAVAFIFQVFVIENKGVSEILKIIVRIYLQGEIFFLLLHPASEGRGQQKRRVGGDLKSGLAGVMIIKAERKQRK